MTKVSRWPKPLMLLAALSLVAAACGDDDDSETAETSGGATTEAPVETTADTTAPETTEAPVETTADTSAGTTEASVATTAECPDGDSVPVAVPYEANQPAGENWRLGLEMAVAEINDAGGILGCQIVPEFQDTQADPDVSKQVVADMAEGSPYVFLGTVFSSNTIVNMVEAQRAEIPMFVGAEAPAITNREENGDNDFIYRTSFGVDTAAAKFIDYIVDQGVTSVDMIYKNDEFGAGGRDAYAAAFDEVGIAIQLDIQVQPDQIDLSSEVAQLAGGEADAIFAFMTEIETAAFLDEVQAQALEKPIYGGDVLSAASTIALVQPGAADGTQTHAGLNASAPVFADWKEAYAAFHPSANPPDHNSIKGYTAVYIVKEITERIGSFDNSQFSDQLHCATITVDDEPGVLLDVSYDANGDIDRESYIVGVVNGVGEIVATVPPLGNLADRGC
ncbi:MAG TPA: ABC transporter substrate-binding protein [Ilumatobacteraceae bacterium]|nr:ABC transporter substrate-binding protein [Ilumatobacteraceae bacterium]